MLFLIVSCQSKEASKEIYYQEVKFNRSKVVVNPKLIKSLYFHSPEDTLIETHKFYIDDDCHEIRKYTNYHSMQIDGDHCFYELDSLGVVLGLSYSWKSGARYVSTNDSINNLINLGLSIVMVNNEKNYFQNFKHD